MKTFTKYPKSYVRAALNPSDFVIENGVLKKYVGPGGDVVIPKGVKEIGKRAFMECFSLTSITIPEGVTTINIDAFFACTNLTSITISDGVTTIGNGAFGYCSSLTDITIPDSVISIGDNAFSNCESLTSVTIPESVTYIGDRAFSSCSILTSITIPESVASIGDYAFYGCTNLTSVDMLGNPKIGKNSFRNTPVESKFSKKKKSASKKKRTRESFEDIDEWYYSEQGEEDNNIFAEELKNLVLNEFPGADYFEEPSVQGLQGGDFITLTVDGTTYSFEFDFTTQLEMIFEEGPEEAARYYYNQIIDNMDEEHIVEE